MPRSWNTLLGTSEGSTYGYGSMPGRSTSFSISSSSYGLEPSWCIIKILAADGVDDLFASKLIFYSSSSIVSLSFKLDNKYKFSSAHLIIYG